MKIGSRLPCRCSRKATRAFTRSSTTLRIATAWAKLLEEINGKFGNLHLVVNNAGVKTLRQASQAKFDEWDNAVAVNFTAIYNSVAACLPHMLKHGEGGHFVTTASMGGILPGVNAGVYTSTKIAAVGIMEALRVELESTSVGTSVFCPGLVSTDNYPMGEENPFRTAEAAKAGRAPPPSMPAVGMDPLEAGERVLHGVAPQRPVHPFASGVRGGDSGAV